MYYDYMELTVIWSSYRGKNGSVQWGGYCRVDSIKSVPYAVQYRVISRIQPTMSNSKLRRLMKRGSISQNDIPVYKEKKENRMLNAPYIELISGSNGKRHRRYIEFGALQNNQVFGNFDSFGLSKTATVPWF